MVPLLELLVVLAFAAGWMVLEHVGRRLDREKEARERAAGEAKASAMVDADDRT